MTDPVTDPDRLAKLKTQLAKVERSGSPQRFLGPWSLADVTWLIGQADQVERLREVETDWNRVREELTNAKRAIANITQRLDLKLNELSEQDAEIKRLRKEEILLKRVVEHLRDLLKQLEWACRMSGDVRWCPACGESEPVKGLSFGHAPDCWLAAELT